MYECKHASIDNQGIPSQERVEGEVGDEDAIEELYDAREHEEDQERVNGLEARRSRLVVGVPQRQDGALLRARRGRLRLGCGLRRGHFVRE